MKLAGTVKNGVVIPDPGCVLAEGSRVELLVADSADEAPQPTLAEKLLKHAGKVKDLPNDLADQHDHYLRGTPKS